MTGGKTSITLFDKDKKPVASGVISRCTSACPRPLPRAWPIRGEVRWKQGPRPCFVMSGLPQGQRAEPVARA